MNCPRCGLAGSWLGQAGTVRRYECRAGHRFSTLEVATPPAGSIAYRALVGALRQIKNHWKERACSKPL